MPLLVIGGKTEDDSNTLTQFDPITGNNTLTGDTGGVIWDPEFTGTQGSYGSGGRVRWTGRRNEMEVDPQPGDTGHKVGEGPVSENPTKFPDLPADDYGTVDDVFDGGFDHSELNDFWEKWTGAGTYGHAWWENIDPTIRSEIESLMQNAGGHLTPDQWSSVHSYLNRLNVVSISGDQAAINQAYVDLRTFLDPLLLPENKQDRGRVDVTTAPVDEPYDTDEAGSGEAGSGGEETPAFNTDFLYSANNAWLTQYTSNIEQVGSDIAAWYANHNNVSQEAVQAMMTNFLQQVNAAIDSGDNAAALRLADSLRSVSPTLANAIKNFLNGPGEGFETFTYSHNQYTYNPDTQELKVWDRNAGAWVVPSYTLAPGVMDYYINNVHKGPVDEVTSDDDNKSTYVDTTVTPRVRIEARRGHGGGFDTVWSDSENRRVVPEFDFNPNTGLLDWEGSNINPASGEYPKGVIDILIKAGWKTDQEGGAKNYKNWKWRRPGTPKPPEDDDIVVEGPPPEDVDVRLVGRTGA